MKRSISILNLGIQRNSILFVLLMILAGCSTPGSYDGDATSTEGTGSLSATTSSGLIFEDDFSTNNGGWGIGDESNGRASVGDGEFHVRIYKNEEHGFCIPAELNITDAIINFDVRQDFGDPETTYAAISFREDNEGHYSLAFAPDGYYSVGKEYQGEHVFLSDWGFSPFLNEGLRSNRITLTQKGGLFEIYFNGNFVISFSDNSLYSGDISLCVFPGPDSDAEYAFDNLTVYKYDSQSAYLPKKPATSSTHTFRSITWLELADFLSRDHTNWNEYVPGEYVCTDFAIDLVENALKDNIKAWIVSVDFTTGDIGHAFVAFETSDKGIVYVEPQGDNPYVDVAVGNNLCDYWGKAECMGVVSSLKYVQCDHEKHCWNYNPGTSAGQLPSYKVTSPPRATSTAAYLHTPQPTRAPIQPTLQPTVSHPTLDITIKVTNHCSEQSTVLFKGPMNLKYVVDPGETQEWQAARGTYSYTVDGFTGTESPKDLFVSVWTLTLCP